ncbi:MAG TPA: site-specific integrase, partial [Candidatus Tectomicrobia bacterium]
MAQIVQRQARGKTVYGVRVRRKGAAPLTATFERLTDAKAWATRMEASISENRAVPGSAARRHTVSEAIERYIATVLPAKRPSTRATQVGQLKWWDSQIGYHHLVDIAPAVLTSCRDALRKQHGPATTVRYLAVLSHLFTVVVREWQWIEENPLRRVRKPKEPRGRVRYLTPDELTRLLAACQARKDSVVYILVLLALSTGGRKGDLLGLRWSDVDIHQGRVSFSDTKNGEVRSVPLTGPALDLLREHAKVRRLDSPLVFPNKLGTAGVETKRAWRGALRVAQIEDFRFHDLR